MKRFLLILALMSALVVLAVPTVVAQDACDDAIGCVVVGPDDPIVIGYMLTVSGPTAFLGEDSAGAVELVILQRDGELLGREIELIEEDSLCSAEGGQQAAQRIAADESMLGVIGTSCSSAGVAALPIISEAGLVMISPTNTALSSPTLTKKPVAYGKKVTTVQHTMTSSRVRLQQNTHLTNSAQPHWQPSMMVALMRMVSRHVWQKFSLTSVVKSHSRVLSMLVIQT